MAMWLVPMATKTMFSELISSEPKRVKTELLLILPGALGTGRADEELSVCTCMCVCVCLCLCLCMCVCVFVFVFVYVCVEGGLFGKFHSITS